MTAPVGMRALLLAAAVAAIQVADALSSTPMTTARAWITLAGAATRDAPSKSPADYPLDSIFKLASNNSGVVVDTRLSSIMDHAVEVDDGDAADEAVLAHVATEAALRGGPCAVALLRALPDSKLATLMVLGAITLAAKGALQAPTAVVFYGPGLPLGRRWRARLPIRLMSRRQPNGSPLHCSPRLVVMHRIARSP
ncbi:hypothetical protein FOCC_FOCC008960 [Frankliniella occidentalis]|nr:hypothetical protein FOCC_FOCC008960 [Frankliniella occidentalis]